MRRHRWRDNSGVFFANRMALVGVVILVFFLIMSVVHPVLMQTIWNGEESIYDPVAGYDGQIRSLLVVDEVTDPSTEISLVDARFASRFDVRVGEVVEARRQPAPPSWDHWLGTDVVGRDVFSQLVAGARPTVTVGLFAALTTAVLGIATASLAAVYRGVVDSLLSKVADSFLLFPAPLVMVVFGTGAFGQGLSPMWFGVAYGVLAGAGPVAIVLRSHALTIMTQPFIEVAVVSGASRSYLLRKHLLPHLLPLAGVATFTAIVGAVIAHGFAGWLTFATDVSNWGAMVFIGMGLGDALGRVSWLVMISGTLAISLFALSFYLVSLGLRDVAYPQRRLRRRHLRLRLP